LVENKKDPGETGARNSNI